MKYRLYTLVWCLVSISVLKSTGVLLTPDVARIIQFSYEIAQEHERTHLLQALYQATQYSYCEIDSVALAHGLETTLSILENNTAHLPAKSNWEVIKESIRNYQEALARSTDTTTLPRIGCNCSNCRFTT